MGDHHVHDMKGPPKRRSSRLTCPLHISPPSCLAVRQTSVLQMLLVPPAPHLPFVLQLPIGRSYLLTLFWLSNKPTFHATSTSSSMLQEHVAISNTEHLANGLEI